MIKSKITLFYSIKVLSFTLFVFLLVGCANPFVTFYQDRTGGRDIAKVPSVLLSTGEPKMHRGADKNSDYPRMLENGYNLIGYSSFNGANINFEDALAHAKAVKAEIVLVYSKHTETHSGLIPLTLPEIQTSSTTLSGNFSGSSGYTGFSGVSKTTTYGTQTTYIPYNVDRYDVFASYWVKLKPLIFGVHVRDLSPDLRRKIGSNKGVHVIAVVRDSYAWSADILRDDVITKIADIDIIDNSNYAKVVAQNQGKKVLVEILRNDQKIIKNILLN